MSKHETSILNLNRSICDHRNSSSLWVQFSVAYMHWPDISRQPSQLTQLSDVGLFVIPPGSNSFNVIMLPDANSVISSPFCDDPSTATPECNDHDGGWLHEHMRNST